MPNLTTNNVAKTSHHHWLRMSLVLIVYFCATATTAGPLGNPNTLNLVTDCETDQLCFAVDAAQHSPISRYIFGSNQTTANADRRFTLHRFGGNRLTAYNWENNASNAGEDYFNQNDSHLGGGNTPGEAARSRIADAHANNSAALVTIPIQGYVAADKNGGGDVNQTLDYLDIRFHESLPRKSTALTLSPNLNDDYVYQDEFVNFLENQFSAAHTPASPELLYGLDNEPALWALTHPRIQPNPVTFADLIAKTLAFSEAIKDVAPNATIFGPVSYGWSGFTSLQSASDNAGRNFLQVYLEAVNQRSQSQGTRLVDVVDVHWYSEAQGNGTRVINNDNSSAVSEARMQAPRSLWDDSYTEDSWIAQWATSGPIKLLPHLQAIIDNAYPGTKLAFTEYNHGGGNHISGAIAQADTLGIFARDGVFAAAYWALGDETFAYAAFDMYRNFDDSDRRFGDTALATDTSDTQMSSVYASIDDDGRMIMVAINKSSASKSAVFELANNQPYQNAEFFHLTAASPYPQQGSVQILNGSSQFTATLPAKSVTTIVLSGEVTEEDDTPPPDDTPDNPPPTEPLTLFNGETEKFSAGWALNDGKIFQSKRVPFSAPRHIRARIPVIDWWGGAGYAFYNWASGDWSDYNTLRFQARVNRAVNVKFNLSDGNQINSQTFNIELNGSYQQVDIPLTELTGVDLTKISQLQLGISVSGRKRYTVDIDDIQLIP